jgi:hypothetical protein
MPPELELTDIYVAISLVFAPLLAGVYMWMYKLKRARRSLFIAISVMCTITVVFYIYFASNIAQVGKGAYFIFNVGYVEISHLDILFVCLINIKILTLYEPILPFDVKVWSKRLSSYFVAMYAIRLMLCVLYYSISEDFWIVKST